MSPRHYEELFEIEQPINIFENEAEMAAKFDTKELIKNYNEKLNAIGEPLDRLDYTPMNFQKVEENFSLVSQSEYDKIRAASSVRFQSKSLFFADGQSQRSRNLMADLFEDIMKEKGVKTINVTHIDPSQFIGKFVNSCQYCIPMEVYLGIKKKEI